MLRNNDPFIDFCTDRQIIKELIKIKIKRIKRRQKILSELYYKGNTKRISSEKNFIGWDRIFLEIFPSRREINLHRPSLVSRHNIIEQGVQTSKIIDGSVFYKIALKNTIKYESFKNFTKLKEFCQNIRERILKIDSYGIHTPKNVIIPKGPDKFRVLSVYNPIDGLVLSLFSKYIRVIYDDCFSESALAFRENNESDHNNAFSKILDWKSKHISEDIYFFEYDFKSFYDSIDHQIILSEFHKIQKIAFFKSVFSIIKNVFVNFKNLKFDLTKLYRIFRGVSSKSSENIILFQYLYNYCYRDVLETIYHSGVPKYKEEAKKALNEHSDKLRYGIPQGTSLSCFLANVTLNSIDIKMNSLLKNSNNGIFLRYCDDSILLGTNKLLLLRLEAEFKKISNKLKLLYHHAPETIEYNKDYWTKKSKPTRLWCDNCNDVNQTPYISFVGYELHYNGTLQIRKKSIQKEALKQKLIVNRAIKAIQFRNRKWRNINLTKNEFLSSVIAKLCAVSVGYSSITKRFGRTEKCWVDSWTLFYRHKTIPLPYRQIKYLTDRRKWAISKLIWFVKNHSHYFTSKSSKKTSTKLPWTRMLSGIYTYKTAMEHRKKYFPMPKN